MGDKVKPRSVAAKHENGRKVRNYYAQDAAETGRYKGGPMKDRRDRRAGNKRVRESDFEDND